MNRITRFFAKAILAGLSALLCPAMWIACTPMIPMGKVMGPKTYRVGTQIYTQGYKRNYNLHIPTNYDGQNALPLVVVIHGAFDTAEGVEKVTQFSALADRANFIVLYPNGISLLGFLQHWNAGHCCGKAAQINIDDVGFVAAAIKATIKRLKVAPDKIYMIGFSNGGMFVHRFAAEKGGMLAGAAVLAGSICSHGDEDYANWQIPPPEVPLPMLLMHAEDDESVPFYGEQSQRGGGPSTYCTVAESVAFWRQNNGCNDPAIERSLFEGTVCLKQWHHCNSTQVVELYAIKKWGHIWPGRYFTAQLKPDHPMKSFDAAQIAWQFFKDHSR